MTTMNARKCFQVYKNDKIIVDKHDEFDNFANSIAKYSELITKDREQYLAKIIQSEKSEKERQDAIDELVTANLRLVLSVCRKIQLKHTCPIRPVSSANLISAGIEGLILSAKRFDGRAAFSTYAHYQIKTKAIRSLIKQQNLVRVPFNVIDSLSKINKLKNQGFSDDEIIEELGISRSKFKGIEKLSKMSYVSRDMLDNLNERESPEFFRKPEDNINVSDLREIIESAMKNLTDVQKETVNMVFLSNPEEKTNGDIAKILNVSHQAITSRTDSVKRNMKKELKKMGIASLEQLI
jgi:RNA polymerase sigma factor (sigma-70 family)